MVTASDKTGPSEAPLHLPAIPADIYCTRCAYNLFGCTSDRCPECGRSLTNLRSPESRIPWVHRRRIGRIRAYWQTVWMVTFSGRGFFDEYARPLRISDAQAFQWLTVAHVFVAAIIVVVALYQVCPPCVEVPDFGTTTSFGTLRVPTEWDWAYAEVWPVAVLLACFLLLLAAATAMPGHFFHPRGVSVERQNSGIALSLYACGPLAFLLVLVPILAGVCRDWSRGSEWVDGMAIASALIVAIPPVLGVWFWNLVCQTGCTLPQFRYRSFVVAAALPVIWLILTGVFLVALPLTILYTLVIISSLS